MHFVVMSFCMRLHYSYKLESTKFKKCTSSSTVHFFASYVLTTIYHHALRYPRTLIRKRSHNHSMTNNVLRIVKNTSIPELLVETTHE
jgi:hypothetical protein